MGGTVHIDEYHRDVTDVEKVKAVTHWMNSNKEMSQNVIFQIIHFGSFFMYFADIRIL